ncbi:MAG TPA: adenylate/guanylate cyclase domain-containing protein [Candidatus Binatia bacterium]|nr:adenylate/guanylate cyclase domain-containing protein [Candidatus Binatia bacterium]
MIARRLRLVSGLVLLTYLGTHFINHALGLISLEAMEAGREISDLMARQPDWFDRTLLAANVPRGQQRELLAALQNWPLKIGVGIHCGPAVVGRMGHGSAVNLTAIGDTVNVASRLQDLTKEYGCQLVISEQVTLKAGLDATSFPRHELSVRNRGELLTIYTIQDVQTVMGGPTI